MQTGGGFVQHKQCTTFGYCLLACRFTLRCFSQKTRQFEPLCFAAGERGHRLAEFDVLQAHIHSRLQNT